MYYARKLQLNTRRLIASHLTFNEILYSEFDINLIMKFLILCFIIIFAWLCKILLLVNCLRLRFIILELFFSLYFFVLYVNIHVYCFYSLFSPPRWMRKLSTNGMESAFCADSRLSRTRTRSITDRVGMCFLNYLGDVWMRTLDPNPFPFYWWLINH